jgi:hypothetical protein
VAENAALAADGAAEALRAAADLAARAESGRRPERWVIVEVEEAYIHCSKHIPRLHKGEKEIPWGTDDAVAKGGDFFGVRDLPRPWHA